MTLVLVKNANRMMTVADLNDEGIHLGFADGSKGVIPFDDLPELKNRAEVRDIELPNPYEMVVESIHGERIEIPWDFARHYCDVSYRPAIEAIAARGRQSLGNRIRRSRLDAGLTQKSLAGAASIGRVTLVRIENGEQSPKFKTLDALANALGVRVTDLLVESDWVNR